MTCNIADGGLVVLPLGGTRESIKNCRKTILNPVDPDIIRNWLNSEEISLSRDAVNELITLAERGELIIWAAKPGSGGRGSFKSNLDDECAEKLASSFANAGKIPGDWYMAFYRKRKLVCLTRLVAVVMSDRLSDLLWGGGEWKIFFFGASPGCSSDLDEECTPRPDAGIDYRILLEALGWSEKAQFYSTIARSGLHTALLGISGYCRFLEKILGDTAIINAAERLLRSKHALLLYGPPGTGKTALALCLAERLGARVFMVTGHAWLTRHTIIGGYVLRGASTEWADGVILKATEYSSTGDPSLVVLDEVNRAEPERVLGELFTALSRPDLRLEIPETSRVVSLRRVYVVATANSLDASMLGRMGFALHRRFAVLRLRPRDASEEALEGEAARLLGGGGDCAERAARAGVSAWKTVVEAAGDDEELAPGWAYALDAARAVHTLACAGQPTSQEQACRLAVESVFGEYARMAWPEEAARIIEDAVQSCVRGLGGSGSEG